jgi:hypothetical protein
MRLPLFGSLRIRTLAAISGNRLTAGAGSMAFYAFSSGERLQASYVWLAGQLLYIPSCKTGLK